MAILSGEIKDDDSKNLNSRTLKKAEFQGPVMPWIDPQKEFTAEEKAVQSGFKSRAQVIRERGGNPQDVFDQIKQERDAEKAAGLSFSTSTDQQEQLSLFDNQENKDEESEKTEETKK